MKQIFCSLFMVFVLGVGVSCNAAENNQEGMVKEAVQLVPLDSYDIVDDAVRAYNTHAIQYAVPSYKEFRTWPEIIFDTLRCYYYGDNAIIASVPPSFPQLPSVYRCLPQLPTGSIWDEVNFTFNPPDYTGRQWLKDDDQALDYESDQVQLAFWMGMMKNPYFTIHSIAKKHVHINRSAGFFGNNEFFNNEDEVSLPLVASSVSSYVGFSVQGGYHVVSCSGLRGEDVQANLKALCDIMFQRSLLPYSISLYCFGGTKESSVSKKSKAAGKMVQQYLKGRTIDSDYLSLCIYDQAQYKTVTGQKGWRSHATVCIDPRALHTFVLMPQKQYQNGQCRYQINYGKVSAGKSAPLRLAEVLLLKNISDRSLWNPHEIQKIHFFKNSLFSEVQNDDLRRYTTQVLQLTPRHSPEVFSGETSSFERQYAPIKHVMRRCLSRPDLLFPAFFLALALLEMSHKRGFRWDLFLSHCATGAGYLYANRNICAPLYTSPIGHTERDNVRKWTTISLGFAAVGGGFAEVLYDHEKLKSKLWLAIPPLCAAGLHYLTHRQQQR